MPMGPSSRAMLCARARKAILPPEKPAKCALPRSDAVAPVKMIVPLWALPLTANSSRLTMRLATSRPVRKPAKQAISHILV